MKLRTRDGLILVVAVLAIIGAYLDGDGRWLHWLAKPATTLLIAAIAWQARPAGDAFYRRAGQDKGQGCGFGGPGVLER